MSKAQRKAAMRALEVAHAADAAEWARLFYSWRFGALLGAAGALALALAYLGALSDRPAAGSGCEGCGEVVVTLYRLTGMATLATWSWSAVRANNTFLDAGIGSQCALRHLFLSCIFFSLFLPPTTSPGLGGRGGAARASAGSPLCPALCC